MAEIDDRDVLDGAALEELYGWIDNVPLTRPTKNIARDFSDGVLVSEIIHHYLPRAVDIHNYVAASSSGQKKINWNTLNRKVFAKMSIKLNETTLGQIVEAKPGAIEQVLWDLRRKILEHASASPIFDKDKLVARSKSGLANSNSPRVTPSSNYDYSKSVFGTPSSGRFPYQNGESQYSIPVAVRPSIQRTVVGNTEKRESGFPPRPKLPPQGTKWMNENPHSKDQNTAVTGDSTENSENNAKSVNPPSQIIYRGHKMVPVESLELKEKEIRDLHSGKKTLSVMIERLERLIDIKDQRIEDLSQQVHNIRSMYERVTQSALDGKPASNSKMTDSASK